VRPLALKRGNIRRCDTDGLKAKVEVEVEVEVENEAEVEDENAPQITQIYTDFFNDILIRC
jgi:hypothetical protein